MQKTGLDLNRTIKIIILFLLFTSSFLVAADSDELYQASAVITVAEGKRLIAKAIVAMPEVQKAKQNGMIIITCGTTNTYIAEELLKKDIKPLEFVLGAVLPKKAQNISWPSEKLKEIIIINGQLNESISLESALKQLKAGDIVIKGGNMLDYQNKTVGVFAGAKDGGTTGKILPYVVARKAHLIIPIGLEKQVSGNGLDILKKMQQPIAQINDVPSMFLLTGTIVTEIEAIEILTKVQSFQAGAGGIAGAEGSSWLILRGKKLEVERALNLINSIQGEPMFMSVEK